MGKKGNRRWTEKRRAALVSSIARGEISVQEVLRKYRLTDAEIEAWRKHFLQSTENDLPNHLRDEQASFQEEAPRLDSKAPKPGFDSVPLGTFRDNIAARGRTLARLREHARTARTEMEKVRQRLIELNHEFDHLGDGHKRGMVTWSERVAQIRDVSTDRWKSTKAPPVTHNLNAGADDNFLDGLTGEVTRLAAKLMEAERRNRKLAGQLAQAREDVARLLGTVVKKLLDYKPDRLGFLRRRRLVHRLRKAALVDVEWYWASYPDVAEAGHDPVDHYLRYGAAEGRAPNDAIDRMVGETLVPVPPGFGFLQDVQLVTESGLFDPVYYRETYPELGDYEKLVEHYVRFGGPEGRNPSRKFDAAAYLAKYPDIAQSGMNPLVHYLRYGQEEGRYVASLLESARNLFALHSIEGNQPIFLETLPQPHRPDVPDEIPVAVLAHLHYEQLIDEILDVVEPLRFDELLVTTTSEEGQAHVESRLAKRWDRPFKVRTVPNRGRDIGAFLNEFKDDYRRFGVICKIHAKRSPHLGELGARWRRYLFANLLGNEPLLRRIVHLFRTSPGLGVVYPVPMPDTTNDDWAANREVAKEALDAMGIGRTILDLMPLAYPTATMFWFRPDALAPMFHAFSYEAFPEEPLFTDGTLAHALERLVPYVAHATGMTSMLTARTTSLLEEHKERVIAEWFSQRTGNKNLIMVSHDASNSGAPRTALGLLRHLSEAYGYECLTILLDGGPLTKRFSEFGPVVNYGGKFPNSELLKLALSGGSAVAICNTVLSSVVLCDLHDAGIPAVSLIHEFASDDYLPSGHFRSAFTYAERVIYPAQLVLDDTKRHVETDDEKVVFLPQGLYEESFPRGTREQARFAVCQECNFATDVFLFFACGGAEARKGFDLFIQASRSFAERYAGERPVGFLWVGPVHDPAYLEEQFVTVAGDELLKESLVFLGERDETDRYFLAADAYLLTSRRDPFPGVVLEAMKCALPVVAFDRASGAVEAFGDGRGGYVVPFEDTEAMAKKMLELVHAPGVCNEFGAHNLEQVRSAHNFETYAGEIAGMLDDLHSAVEAGALKVSLVVPAFNTVPIFLQQMIESVRAQTYTNWELCIACAGEDPGPASILRYYASLDSRIRVKFLEENRGIAGNTNAALELCAGEFIGMLDHDDLLARRCLERVIACAEKEGAEVVYTDEDKVDETGVNFYHSVRKEDFSLDTLRRHNYVTHFLAFHSRLLEEIGTLDPEYDGAQDYDLILRLVEKTQKVSHVPEILYHWRASAGSTAEGDAEVKDYAVDAGRRALQAHLRRCGNATARVVSDDAAFRYRIEPGSD